MAQQTLGIRAVADGQRNGGESAKSRDMTRVFLENFAENQLSGLAILRNECRGRRLDAQPMRIGEPGALESDFGVLVLFEFDEHVPVGEPRGAERRGGLHDAPELVARLLEAAGLPVSARKVGARQREFWRRSDSALENLDRLRELALREQRGTQQPQAVDFAGHRRLYRAQLPLGGFRPPFSKRGKRASERSVQPRR